MMTNQIQKRKLVSDADKKNPDTSGLVKKTNYNAKIIEIERKILSTGGLATNAALTAVENKIPYISSLVKKTDYDIKISEIEKKSQNHIIIIMINILLLQNLISSQQKFFLQDQHK